MAKTETTVKGYVYTVTSPNGGTVTDAEGKLNKPVAAGDQVTVQAPSDSLTCDDDDAVIYKTNFKTPLLALRLLGQGENALPAGYTPLAFLGCTGTQYIDTSLPLNNGSELTVDCEITNDPAINSGGVFGAQEGSSTRDRVGWSEYVRGSHVADFHGWVFWGWVSEDTVLPAPTTERHRVQLSQSGLYYNGNKVKDLSTVAAFQTSLTCWLFARNRQDVTGPKYHGKIYSFTFAQDGKPKLNFMPCVDDMGEPCMFDRVSLQPYRNLGTGAFIAGVGTVAQLTALLRRLPSTGGTLTLSLPAEANTPDVADKLQACHDTKGWTLTVHEYRPAAAATYSLRRVREVVWCRREQSDLGSYVDATGTRWQIERCAAIFGRLGNDPTAYGYTPFDSVEQAAESWELQPYVYPNAEELTNVI